ncbi:TRAFAC clade GTPase domain-containing protein [Paractinoplanes globisporus]|uniref:Double-GTPase 2 domain-containing protein n=1 Tax=Paractinoplanes globisporus TaxID=113565 RepID=A0ABW6W754_9ACTN|nr:hypothetical protein [Actinoplanes globisporus]
MAATKGNPGQYTYYTYTPPARDTDQYWRLGFSLLAFPFIVLAGTLIQAGRSITAYAGGVASGLGVGRGDTEELSPRLPPREWEDGREPAYVQYLFGQAWRDVRHTVAVALRRQRQGIKSEFERVQKRRFLPPEDDAPDKRNAVIGAAQLTAIGTGLLLAEALLFVAFVAQAAVLGLLWAGVIAFVYVLILADSALLSMRHIHITCPNPDCHEVVSYPRYACPNCRTLHHDIRPGRYGVIHRTCRCGSHMPTLLMLGSHRMTAICPKCKNPLESNAGRMRELILPVFGSPIAGKTQLLAAVAMATDSLLERAQGQVEPADDPSRRWLRHAKELHTRGGTVTKTTTASQHAVSLQLTHNGRRLLLKMFDAAGETFQDPERIRELRYLRGGGTLLFVLDPLSVPALWNGLGDERRRQLEPIRAVTEPLIVFQETIQTLHQINIDTARFRLAVVVSKADVIAPEVSAARVGDDASIREWLGGPLDQGNLVRSVTHEFQRARFFLTNATLGDRRTHASIETLTSWILNNEGISV